MALGAQVLSNWTIRAFKLAKLRPCVVPVFAITGYQDSCCPNTRAALRIGTNVICTVLSSPTSGTGMVWRGQQSGYGRLRSWPGVGHMTEIPRVKRVTEGFNIQSLQLPTAAHTSAHPDIG